MSVFQSGKAGGQDEQKLSGNWWSSRHWPGLLQACCHHSPLIFVVFIIIICPNVSVSTWLIIIIALKFLSRTILTGGGNVFFTDINEEQVHISLPQKGV